MDFTKKSNKRLYNVWQGMKTRCYNKKFNKYHQYGGKGIIVCDEWRYDFSQFCKWGIENGYDKDAKRFECTLDRINPKGNYEPSNCRWITIKEQENNKIKTVYITYNNITLNLLEWSKITGISKFTLYNRKTQLKWSDEKILITPITKLQKTPANIFKKENLK